MARDATDRKTQGDGINTDPAVAKALRSEKRSTPSMSFAALTDKAGRLRISSPSVRWSHGVTDYAPPRGRSSSHRPNSSGC